MQCSIKSFFASLEEVMAAARAQVEAQPLVPSPPRVVPQSPVKFSPFVTPEQVREVLREPRTRLPPEAYEQPPIEEPLHPKESPRTRMEKYLQLFRPPTPPSPPIPPCSPSPPFSPTRPMRPQALECSQVCEGGLSSTRQVPFPESPSFLTAEKGSPAMLKDVSPQQVYGVEPLDSSVLSPQINIDGEYSS